jgi:hypothetical protein
VYVAEGHLPCFIAKGRNGMRGLPRDLPESLRDLLDRELEKKEPIRWMGQPKPRFWGNRESVSQFLFSIPWTAFALFWTGVAATGVLSDKEFDWRFQVEYIFPLWGLPFILIGLFLMSAPLRHWNTLRKTLYVVTDRRAIVLVAKRSIEVKSYFGDDLDSLSRIERKDGTGSILFHGQSGIGFLSIRNCREVERMLREIAEQSGAR